MTYRKLGDICEKIKKDNNVVDIYQPTVRNNLLYFEKIAESNRISDILYNKVGNNSREITVYSKTYKKEDITSVKTVDMLVMKVTEDDNEEVLVFSFVCESDIDFSKGNHGKYIIEEELTDLSSQTCRRVILREYPFYPGDDKIANLMLRIYIE